jgi:hypothetical protein
MPCRKDNNNMPLLSTTYAPNCANYGFFEKSRQRAFHAPAPPSTPFLSSQSATEEARRYSSEHARSAIATAFGKPGAGEHFAALKICFRLMI